MRFDSPFFTNSAGGKRQIWLPGHLLNYEDRKDLKTTIDNDNIVSPAWFFTGLYWDTNPSQTNLAIARTDFDWFMIRLATKTRQHLLPIHAFGWTKSNRLHNHGVILGERNKLRKITQDRIRASYGNGYSHMRLYDKRRGGIPYTLNHEYIAISNKVYCPHGGCDLCGKFERQFIEDRLRANAGVVGEGSRVLGSVDPLQIAYGEYRNIQKERNTRIARERSKWLASKRE